MKLIEPPPNYRLLEIGEPISYNCLEFDNKTKKFNLVSSFGSHCLRKNKTHQVFAPLDDRDNEIIKILRGFDGYLYERRAIKQGERIALILWFAGAKSIEPSITLWAGKNDPHCLIVHKGSLSVKPYITKPFTNGDNLFWWILRQDKIGFSGGASEDNGGYAQACPATYGDQTKEFVENLYGDMVRYFNALVEKFGVKNYE